MDRCMICQKEKDWEGEIKIRNPDYDEALIVCPDCFNLYANGEFDIISDKLEEAYKNV